jgi:hypothetical protein
LKGHEQHGASHRLLELFAYGTYADYLRARGPPAPHRDLADARAGEQATLPALTRAQLAKLKQLTLVTLASSRRVRALLPSPPRHSRARA